MVTSGDLSDFERSMERFRLMQPSYNWGTTGTISMKVAPIDVPYAFSSAIMNMVTLDDLGELEMSIKQFRLLQPSYNSGSTGSISKKGW